ncbi:MAG: response regulator [Gammaproteobacteria bacterium]|nr:response regulator [Gammaproteobacteria bacterium]
MTTTARLLVVDDDPDLRQLLVDYLSKQGFQVHGVADGSAMQSYLKNHGVDLLLLDLMLPGEDGLTLTQKLRASSALPIIMLSARGDDVDRIVGLEVGADDYLAKPFNPRELLARIKAVLRRRQQPPPPATSTTLQFGPFQLDIQRQRLTRGAEEIPLTTAEFTLLRIFASHPGKVLNRDRIVSLANTDERIPFDRSIDVRVARLRRKIETNPDEPMYIRTVWGAGYLFVPHDSEPAA